MVRQAHHERNESPLTLSLSKGERKAMHSIREKGWPRRADWANRSTAPGPPQRGQGQLSLGA